jgi:putative oxidoreductase
MDKRVAIGWTLVRISFGLLLSLAFGRLKLSSEAMTGFVGAVAALGFPAPALFAWCSALAEFAGGLMFAAGVLTRPVGAVISFNMIVAIYSMRGSPLVMAVPAIQFLLIMIAGVIAGGGPISVDAYWRNRASLRAPGTLVARE